MIPRLYDLDDGSVLVDGVDVKDYSLENLRAGVGMVLQKNLLFSGTIEENLKWGDENATDDEVRLACSHAAANKFIETFSDGYETVLDQGGTNVSGGQKQRLCIARALLKKPRILILDDSTSAVDTATERQIKSAMKNDLPDCTKIIIAQRISSVIEADKIVVMNDGVITGIGTHSELIESNEEYKEIYYSQNERKEEE
jgi:ATP-binding cassette subfamily B protein